MAGGNQVSVKGETYDQLRVVAKLKGVPVSTLVRELIEDFLDRDDALKEKVSSFKGEF